MILLDTQVVFWGITGSTRLGRGALRVLERASTRYVSALTHVEFAVKAMKGKIAVPDDLSGHLASIGLEELPFTHEHAGALYRFDSLVGHDPFDRMLVAQAAVEGLTLVTADRVLLALDQPWIIDATA